MIDLLYCGNEKVFDGVLTSLLSIVMRDLSHDSYRVTIFTMDLSRMNPVFTPISDKLINFLDGVMKRYNKESSVRKVDVTDLYEELLGHSPNEGCYCSPYTLLRLLADKVDGFSSRLLYLDADIMFNRDIHLLTSYDISDYEFAGSNDHYGKYLINPRYMNAGVIYFNLDRCKETGLFEKAREWIWRKRLVLRTKARFYGLVPNVNYCRRNSTIRSSSTSTPSCAISPRGSSGCPTPTPTTSSNGRSRRSIRSSNTMPSMISMKSI